MNHDHVTSILTDNGTIPYGTRSTPSPYVKDCKEWERRKVWATPRQMITDKILALFEPRFITPPETSEYIEALVTMTDSLKILELGSCTGFTSLHILRALWGKPMSALVTIDARPAHDHDFFLKLSQADGAPSLVMHSGWTPACLASENITHYAPYDLVFVDSDHALDHTKKEFAALWQITRPGTILLFHDLPAWSDPTNKKPPAVRVWLEELVRDGQLLTGLVLPTAEQLDCLDAHGVGYAPQLNPHLGVFIRK